MFPTGKISDFHKTNDNKIYGMPSAYMTNFCKPSLNSKVMERMIITFSLPYITISECLSLTKCSRVCIEIQRIH